MPDRIQMTASGMEVLYPEGYEVRPGGLIVRRVEEGIEWAIIDAADRRKMTVVAAVVTSPTQSALIVSGALSKLRKDTPDAL